MITWLQLPDFVMKIIWLEGGESMNDNTPIFDITSILAEEYWGFYRESAYSIPVCTGKDRVNGLSHLSLVKLSHFISGLFLR